MKNELQAIALSATDPVLTWGTDASRHCNYFSESYLQFAGRSFEQMQGDGWATIVHPDDLEELFQVSGEAFAKRLPFTIETRFRRHDGEYRWFLNVGAPQHLSDGTFAGYTGRNFDISTTKQIQQTREEEQERLRSTLEYSSELIALLDCDLKYLYANANYAELIGTTPGQLVGRSALKAMGLENDPETKRRFARVANGETVAFEHIATIDGSSRTLLVKYAPNYDIDDQMSGYYVFADDISELREQQRHFELILENLPARVAYFDCDLKVRYGNRAFLQFHRSTTEQMTGRPLRELIGEPAYQVAEPKFGQAIDGQRVIYEQDRTDQEALVYLVPDLDANGQTIGVYSLDLDIAPLKRAEAQLQRSNRQFELAMQGSQVGFWETEEGHFNHFFTENVESLLGLPQGALGNSREAFYQRIHPDDIGRVRAVDQLQLAEPGTHVSEFRLLTADQQHKWFRSVGETQRDADNRFVRAAGTIANIDELKKAELKAADEVRSRDTFLSMLSHELRNPLSAILFAVDYCRESDQLPADLQPMFDIIARQTEQTSRMLSDLLDVTRITRDRLTFEKSSVNLSELLESVVAAFEHAPAAKSQTLSIEIQPDLFVFGDSVRLHQAFTNLLDNASKYTPPQGAISLLADTPPPCQSSTAAPSLDSSGVLMKQPCVVRVSDSGRGISQTHRQAIFDLFYQEERSTEQSSHGLGLGLFLVRQIIAAHGGTVTVESEGPDKGSCFEVRLPPPVPKPRPNHTATEPRTALPCTIAIVEDNRDACLALAHALSARGMTVTSFMDGSTASEQMQATQPKVALIDIDLPGKSGLQLMDQFRDQPALENTIFIALTGHGKDSDSQAILGAGFDAHVVKPVDMRQLLALVGEFQQASDRKQA